MSTGRRRLWLVGVPILLLSAMGVAAAAFTPVLVRDHPVLLLVLESRNRYLLLVAAKVSLEVFLVVGVLRRFASDPFYFLLGRWYGDRAIDYVARNTAGDGGWIHRVVGGFERFADPLVLLFPGALVSVLAGAGAMSLRRFVALNVVGSLGAVLGLWWLAETAAGTVSQIVAFNDRNADWLTAVFVVVVAVWLLWSARGGGSPVEELRGVAGDDSDGSAVDG